MLRTQTRGPLPAGLPYDPAFFRPTGGGIGASSVIGNTLYSHFPQMELGARQRLHEFNYEGPEHGQDSPEAVCLRQLGFAGVDLDINGSFASGGIAYIPSRTRFIIDSVYDISNATFGIHTFDELGSPIVVTMVGPDAGRTTSTDYGADRVTRVTCSDDTVGTFSVGFQVTPGKMAYRYSDNFGRTWSTPNYLVDGVDNRGYRPALMSYSSGIVVAMYFKLDIPIYETGNFRRVSYDNGVTWGPEEEITFTGVDTGDIPVLHTRWRQLGDVNGAEVQVSIGASGDRSYVMRTTDYSKTIACTKFATVDHGADNDLIYEIDSINDGTNTVTLKASHGDVTGYWPANMASTITGTGGANGNSYTISSSFSAGKTSIVLNELAAGTVGASSKIKRLYGPRQVIDVDIPTNTIRIEGDRPPWYFLSIPDDYNNSGYHSLVFPNGNGVAVMAYGKEKTESTAEVLCRVIDFAPVLTDVVYANREPAVTDDITKRFMPSKKWALYDGSDLFTAISTAEGAADWQSAIPGPKLKSGQYYGNILSGVVATQAITENRLHFVLVEAPGRRVSVQALATYVRSATSMTGAEQFKMAVYADDEGVPGAMIFNAGTIAFTGSAGIQRLEVEDVTVGPGRFWIAMIANLNGGGAMPGLPSSATAGYSQGITGWTGGNYASFVRYVYVDPTVSSWASYTLPDPAPAVTYNDSTGNAIQLVFQVE